MRRTRPGGMPINVRANPPAHFHGALCGAFAFQVLSMLLFDKSDEGNFEMLASIGRCWW